MPKQGQSVESCILTEMKKKKGDTVAVGDILFSYETDKASFEEEAQVAGTVLDVFFDDGDEIPVLTNVMVIGNEGESTAEFRPGGEAAAPQPKPRLPPLLLPQQHPLSQPQPKLPSSPLPPKTLRPYRRAPAHWRKKRRSTPPRCKVPALTAASSNATYRLPSPPRPNSPRWRKPSRRRPVRPHPKRAADWPAWSKAPIWGPSRTAFTRPTARSSR